MLFPQCDNFHTHTKQTGRRMTAVLHTVNFYVFTYGSVTAQSVQWLGYRLDDRAFVFDFRPGEEICIVSKRSRPAARPIQPPIHQVPRVKQPEHKADHSSPSRAKVQLCLHSPTAFMEGTGKRKIPFCLTFVDNRRTDRIFRTEW
jgi:hypothetical protein